MSQLAAKSARNCFAPSQRESASVQDNDLGAGRDHLSAVRPWQVAGVSGYLNEDVRVHFVHSRSRRFPGDVNDCSLCHTTPPSGPARGFPPPAR